MRDNQQSLVDAVLYADIFNFALSKIEILKYATGKCTKQDLNYFLKSPPQFIYIKNGFICLKGKNDLISHRVEKTKISKLKLEKAKKVAALLSIIPSIKFIGLSGAVAVGNSDIDDDIDLFIITESNMIWTTRFITTFFLQLLGKKRSKNKKNSEDKICLNMFIANNSLSFKKDRQDLYTAHEIVQLVPLLDKDNTYTNFIDQNKWVSKFLPNVLLGIKSITPESRVFFPRKLLEKIAKKVQLWYMKKSRTIEVAEDNLLAFHPIDYQKRTLQEFERRKKKYVI